MAIFSGKDGKVLAGTTTLAEITQWTFQTRSNNVAYGSSATAGYRRRVAGAKDGRGTIRGKLDPADPLTNAFEEGDTVTLQLYLDASRFYSVPALIDTLQFEVDIDSGDIVGWVAEFSTDGAWTKPNYAS